MKAIVGTDLPGSYKQAVDLIGRLKFASLEAEFLNVVEPWPSTGWFAPTGYVPPAWDQELRRAGQQCVNEAVLQMGDKIPSQGRVLFGAPADQLLIEADRTGAEIIAIGSHHKGRVKSALIGSVGRSLTIDCRKSVLIVRSLPQNEGPLTVVFATDHSPFAEQCLDKFMKWRPAGIKTIHLVTAVHMEPWIQDVLRADLPADVANPEEWLRSLMEEKSKKVADKLDAAGYCVHAHVMTGYPNDVLHHSMSAFHGDLLICGAQGHGFMERLVVGSVALHQAVAESYSLLLIRP